MIMHLIDRDALIQAMNKYIEERGGTLDGYEDTKHILELIDLAPVISTHIVKP